MNVYDATIEVATKFTQATDSCSSHDKVSLSKEQCPSTVYRTYLWLSTLPNPCYSTCYCTSCFVTVASLVTNVKIMNHFYSDYVHAWAMTRSFYAIHKPVEKTIQPGHQISSIAFVQWLKVIPACAMSLYPKQQFTVT